jgi:hypothetical protein
MEPEQIESVAPSESGEPIVYMGGERLTPRPIGRPRNNPKPEPSMRERMAEFLRKQDIELSDEEFTKVWNRYCELRTTWAADQMPTYFIWSCPGCLDADAVGHRILNGKHWDGGPYPTNACDGINDELKTLWPRSAVEAVAKAKGITIRF